MRRTLKVASLLLTLVMLATCGVASGFAQSDEPVNDPITFTIYVEDTLENRIEENFQGTVSKKITEDTGVTIKYNFGVGDVSEQVTLMVADRSYPDFVFSRSHLYNFLEAEAYIDLAPLVEEYGPNIKALYGEYYDALKDDEGHIYYLGQDYVNPIMPTKDPEDSFALQLAVVKELGYPEIRTLDQFADAIRTYKEMYPTIDGQPTIGLTLTCGDGWRYYITLINPGIRSIGGPDDGNYIVDPDTMETVFAFTVPELKEYYRWLNGLYDEGLLDPDAFTQTHDEYLAKVSSGRVLALTDGDWEYAEAEDILRNDGKPERTYARFPVTQSNDIPHPAYRPYAYLPQNGVGITDNCSDPVRAIQFLDYLCREETQILTSWGFEGVNWEIRDGMRKPTAEEKELQNSTAHIIETGIGLMTYPWPVIGAKKDKDGYWMVQSADDDSLIEGYTEAAKEVLAGYNVSTWKALYPSADTFKESSWGQAWLIFDNQPPDSEFNIIQDECNALTAQYLAMAASASPDKFDEVWDEFMVRLQNAGVEKLGELATELVKKTSEWASR